MFLRKNQKCEDRDMIYKKRKRKRQNKRQKMHKRSRIKAVGWMGVFLLVIGSAGCVASKGSLTALTETSITEQTQREAGEEAVGSKNIKQNKNTAPKEEKTSEKKKENTKNEKKAKEKIKTKEKTKAKDSKRKEKQSTNRVAFLGDSRTEGLALSQTYQEADFYAKCGICLNQIENKKNFLLKNGQRGNMLDALFQKDYDKIYLMFGLNELGWPYEEEFEKYYESLVNQIKEHYPKAEIYIQSILPVVESKGDKIFNNKNIDKFNGYVKKVAKNTGAIYIDVASSMKKNGGLPEDASEDGIHLNRGYMEKWSAFLKENT